MEDVAMMILLAGKERTRNQWEQLVRSAGLKIGMVHNV